MNKSLLITRPEYDPATHYLYKWSEKVIEEAEKKSIHVIDLTRNKSTRNKIIGILEKRSPRLVFLNGHGSEDMVTGQNNEVVLKTDDKKAVWDKIIYARSCKSAKVLGLRAIVHGAIAYLGYKEDFIFFYSPEKVSRPLEDKTASLFLKPSNYLVISLLKGHSAGEANRKSKAFFRKNIEKLLVKESEDYYAIRYLYWDMIHQVCLGDEGAVF